jgi:hypothetical protein
MMQVSSDFSVCDQQKKRFMIFFNKREMLLLKSFNGKLPQNVMDPVEKKFHHKASIIRRYQIGLATFAFFHQAHC